ncbi:alpha/beta hydrolase [Microbacterium sp.]|uniref:alpha/beta hydrolase n=1 Tax=Microbacterium sp. TaxID=51671 RepID=UPI002E31E82B|nr:alpha/beta fold hydrolase [Microbacterium sp.]HEX5728184.1 alpha/beta fold hydrolase [Microbacterium sp.]
MRDATDVRTTPSHDSVSAAEKAQRPGDDQRAVGVRLIVILAATPAGCAAVSLGLGVALPRTRDSVPAVAFAVVALASGSLLLVIAGVLLFQVTRAWLRLVFIPWIVSVLVVVYSLSIALAAVFPPHPSPSLGMPAGAARIEMTAVDGVRLSGWYLPSRNGAAVVLRHGAGSTAADTVAHAVALNDAGYGVLSTDARGHGDSGGQGMDLGWFGEADTRAALDALAERSEIDPDRIGVVGLSMGGEEAIGAAGVDHRIRAVVAEGATGRTAADKAWLADEYGVAGIVQGALDTLTYAIVDILTPAAPPRTLEQSIRDGGSTPVLLISAGENPDEQSVSARLAAVDPARVEVWVVPGADHVRGLATAPDEWRLRVVGFLDAALRARSG